MALSPHSHSFLPPVSVVAIGLGAAFVSECCHLSLVIEVIKQELVTGAQVAIVHTATSRFETVNCQTPQD